VKCECGVEMNHHADKPVEPRTDEEARTGLAIEQTFQCPECGAVESKREAL